MAAYYNLVATGAEYSSPGYRGLLGEDHPPYTTGRPASFHTHMGGALPPAPF